MDVTLNGCNTGGRAHGAWTEMKVLPRQAVVSKPPCETLCDGGALVWSPRGSRSGRADGTLWVPTGELGPLGRCVALCAPSGWV